MRHKRKICVTAAFILVVLIAAGWYFGSPAWTLSRMKAAAQANDPDALSAYVDYPALRENFKSEIMARMMAAAQRDRSGFGGLGVAVGSAMVGPMVDGMISPAGLRAALMAKREEAAGIGVKATNALKIPEDPVITRRSFSEFVVGTKHQPKSGLVFKLQGLSWKLSGVALQSQSDH